jgi:hypothetical protein
MLCPVMVGLIKKLDSVRLEQSSPTLTICDAEKRKRLRIIEAFLDRHEQTCATCRRFNPHGTQFVESSSRR